MSIRTVRCEETAASIDSGTPPSSWHPAIDRKSTRLNSSHSQISYAVFCLKKKKHKHIPDDHCSSGRISDDRPFHFLIQRVHAHVPFRNGRNLDHCLLSAKLTRPAPLQLHF